MNFGIGALLASIGADIPLGGEDTCIPDLRSPKVEAGCQGPHSYQGDKWVISSWGWNGSKSRNCEFTPN